MLYFGELHWGVVRRAVLAPVLRGTTEMVSPAVLFSKLAALRVNARSDHRRQAFLWRHCGDFLNHAAVESLQLSTSSGGAK